jgi:Ca2+/Na+ antiporter
LALNSSNALPSRSARASHFTPLQSGVIGVLDQKQQSSGGQEEGHTLKQREGKYLEFIAFLLFVVRLWFVYTAFTIEKKTVVRISKIFVGIVILVFGTAVEQAALNLKDFSRIDWKHLFF